MTPTSVQPPLAAATVHRSSATPTGERLDQGMDGFTSTAFRCTWAAPTEAAGQVKIASASAVSDFAARSEPSGARVAATHAVHSGAQAIGVGDGHVMSA